VEKIVDVNTTGGQKFTSLPKIKKIIDVITIGGQKFGTRAVERRFHFVRR
jgi:hypothetical protein